MATERLVVSYKGAPLVGQHFGGGGVLYIEDYAAAVGLDLAGLVDLTANTELYIPMEDPAAKIRGWPMMRSKFFVNCTGDANQIAAYHYPGFNWRSAGFYKSDEDADVRFLKPVLESVRSLEFNGVKGDFNQLICTNYLDGNDKISYHQDDMRSIAENSIIFDISLGAERTFMLRNEVAEESIRMKSGSAIVMTTAANLLYEHAVLPEACDGSRRSLVFRNIKTMVTRDQVLANIAKAAHQKVKRDAKRLADGKVITEHTASAVRGQADKKPKFK